MAAVADAKAEQFGLLAAFRPWQRREKPCRFRLRPDGARPDLRVFEPRARAPSDNSPISSRRRVSASESLASVRVNSRIAVTGRWCSSA